MTAPALPKFNRTSSVVLDAEREELLDALAAKLGGSRSEAMRHLIDVHAGRVLEEIPAPALEDVDGWKRRRLSRELIGEVAARIRAGAVRADAYRMSGVTSQQASQWLSQGRADVRAGKSSLHADFVMYLERVEAEVRLARAQKVTDAKWHLERDASGIYAKIQRTDSTVTHQFNLVVDWEALTLAEARTLVALLRKASPDAGDPALGRRDRPAAELIPPDVMADVLEHEPDESPETRDESPSTSGSPVTSSGPLALEAGPQ